MDAGDNAPEPVPVTRARVVAAEAFPSEDDAGAWLDRCRGSEAEREAVVSIALGAVNRAVHGHRVAAADPYVREVGRRQAREVRIGYGSGDELVEGGWRVAYTVPAPKLRTRRRQALEPQHELAGVLAGRRPAWPSEDLALRARLDVDHGRLAQAALQLQAALTAFEAELEGRDESAKRFASGADPAGVRSLVERALGGPLTAEDAQELEQKVSELERVLRRRRFEAAKR